MLVKWSKAMNEPIDPDLLEEVTRYEQIQKEIIESVKQNSINDLVEASKVAEDFVKKVNIEYPKPPSLDEVMQVLKEEQNELVQAQATKVSPEPQSLAKRAAEHITKEALLEKDSFQQPNPPVVDKNFEAVQRKLKFLEQAIGKIAAHGPGGGDANPFDRVEFMDRGVRFTPTPRMMYWNNVEDCVNITQADGSTLQVGLENYIRVFNNTANTFANGTFVEFTGIDAEGDAPTFRSFVNNANTIPLYNIGVLTTDVASNTHGRATVLGLVRGLDTTGNAVGEVWASGDILWASPTYPGNYTKFKPTAPNVALSVAAVTVSDPNEGIILVRPTVWPRLQYADFYRTDAFVAPSTNTDVEIPLSNTLITSGFLRSGNSIIALNSGLYKFDARAQISSSSSNQKSIVFWYKKNGQNIPYSSVRASIATNGGYGTVTNTQLISLTPGDNVTLHFAVTDTTLFIDSPAILDASPNVPSVQLTVIEAAL